MEANDIVMRVDRIIDIERYVAGNNEVDDMLFIEANDIMMRADLIIIKGSQATTSTSTPAILSSTTIDIIRHRSLKLSLSFIFVFSSTKLISLE